MDKKTIIGLGLIGTILVIFSFLNKPSEEEIERQRAEQELAQKMSENDTIQNAVVESENLESELLIALLDEEGNPLLDSLGNEIFIQDTSKVKIVEDIATPQDVSKQFKEETFVLENEKLSVVFTNKGGGVKSVFLKTHQTYENYIKNRGSDEIEPLLLFNEAIASNGLYFQLGDQTIRTKEMKFEVGEVTDNSISFILNLGSGKSIEQVYRMTNGDYHIDYEIKTKGLNDVPSNRVFLDWQLEMLKTEKLLSEQRRISTIFYKENEGKYKYLSEMKDDEVDAPKDVDWVAFKQSYFSSILMPKSTIKKEGTHFGVHQFNDKSAKDSTHIKAYTALINLGVDNPNNSLTEISWYFGPNDYDLLKSYENGTEDLLNYGWGLFRWINIYAIQPMFVWLANMGMNLGIAILILTVIIKLVLTPIQWKMYLSSAKMRILKPEIESINQKFPKKEQAMEKQMEMMALYRETGSSPLAGCFPMLIQMPILFAVFRFFPSTFSLRQQSFLWADDLSSYDSIWDFGVNIPLYGDHVSLFTLLMAATTLIYTILNSSNQMQQTQPGMPNMKVIMYIFPFMMIFFFNNYASGLSYYYFISTLMSILTMVAIKNFFVDEEKLKLKMAERQESAKKVGGKKGKSKFQQRLEEMQKMQQEKMKNKK